MEAYSIAEHVLFWLPIINPVLQVVLLPMAVVFYLFPDTEWTSTEKLPREWPGTIYTWFVGKIMVVASYTVMPLAFFGHPLNFLVYEEIQKFFDEDFSAMTSQETAEVLVLLWMALPYVVPFALVNNIYLWYLQIPHELYLYYRTKYHLVIHYDTKCLYR